MQFACDPASLVLLCGDYGAHPRGPFRENLGEARMTLSERGCTFGDALLQFNETVSRIQVKAD